MERRKFTREFKLEAVRLIKDRGVSYVQASADLNVHPSQLRDWVKKFADDPQHAFPGNGQSGLKRSSQQPEQGGCDEASKTAFRSGWTCATAFARPTFRC